MITLLGSLIGFISSMVPDLLKLFNDRADKKHELDMLKLQADNADKLNQYKMEELGASADAAQYQALYKTYTTGINWVDALNGTVRPVIAYSFFALYALIKTMQFKSGMYWLLWTEEDQAIFAGIISFYFGQRSLKKASK